MVRSTSTLFRHEHEAFPKRSSIQEKSKTPIFRSVQTESTFKTKIFEDNCATIITCPTWQVIVVLSNSTCGR